MTKILVERSGKTEGSPMYNMNPEVNDLLVDFMVKHDGMKLMVLGAIQTGDKGCACPESNVLRRMLTKLLLSKDQVVLLDMEAGVEHLGRGTIAGIDHLLIVVIPSKSSIRTALKVKKLAEDVKIPKISFVGNLVTDEDDEIFQFPMAVVIQGNLPREGLEGTAGGIEDPGLCENKNTFIEVNIYDSYLENFKYVRIINLSWCNKITYKGLGFLQGVYEINLYGC